MRILVCGGRDYKDKDKVFSTLQRVHEDRCIDSIVHGGCSGADSIADDWAKINGIHRIQCPANWEFYKGYAGPHRNKFMATLGIQGAIAFTGGNGTRGMVSILEGCEIKVMKVD